LTLVFVSALALSVLTNKKLKNSESLKISADELSHMVTLKDLLCNYLDTI